jgi:hypothetical protein
MVDAGESLPSLEVLARHWRGADLSDRAYANGVLRIRYARLPDSRAETRQAYQDARACSLSAHGRIRDAIRDGSMRGERFRSALEGVGAESRDYWAEEVLDLAFPPLGEMPLPPGLTPYIPSGVSEVLHALDLTSVGAEDVFVDVGAGLGKVLLLASLIAGARGHGVELDPSLVAHGRGSAATLGLDGVTLVEGDAAEADLGAGSVYYLFSPFTGVVLDRVMQRLESIARQRDIYVCASAVDGAKYPWLSPVQAPSSWLVVYRTGPTRRMRPATAD